TMLETLQKNWWLIAVRGVLAILFGVLALASPYIVIFSLITFFAFFAILSGFFILTLAFLGETDNRGLRIIEGLIFLGAGIVVLLNPVSALGGIMIFIAAWAILSGIIHIIGAVKMRKVITNEWLLILNGVVSIIFGILLAGNLIQGAGVMLMVFGAFAILSGIFSIMLAFRIKTYKAN
ncbi:MAG TPA: DUF308 domain-containing protein, partial [Ignavibacteria bacterium]|nr:hypothetical protein [Bacteroidota bacterium]HRJ04018.1 DUF308 domain-containing protein [Ignavibacteria bacterium]HRJ86230.1 DUF308 domain-containing protein [Ignavibacteria bacterium]